MRSINANDWQNLQIDNCFGANGNNDSTTGTGAVAFLNMPFSIAARGYTGIYIPYLSCRNLCAVASRCDLEIIAESDRNKPSNPGRATLIGGGSGSVEPMATDIEDYFAIQLPLGTAFQLTATQGTPNVLATPIYIPKNYLFRIRSNANPATTAINFAIFAYIPIMEDCVEINLA